MSNQSSIPTVTTLNLSADLGYKIVYQPIIGNKAPQQYPLTTQYPSSYRSLRFKAK